MGHCRHYSSGRLPTVSETGAEAPSAAPGTVNQRSVPPDMGTATPNPAVAPASTGRVMPVTQRA